MEDNRHLLRSEAMVHTMCVEASHSGYVAAVAERRSFRRAGGALSISQPSLNHYFQQLLLLTAPHFRHARRWCSVRTCWFLIFNCDCYLSIALQRRHDHALRADQPLIRVTSRAAHTRSSPIE